MQLHTADVGTTPDAQKNLSRTSSGNFLAHYLTTYNTGDPKSHPRVRKPQAFTASLPPLFNQLVLSGHRG